MKVFMDNKHKITKHNTTYLKGIMDRYESAYEKLKDLDSKRDTVDLEDFEEFMRKVEEVNKMVHALTSNNKSEVEEATLNADAWLKKEKNMKRNDKEMSEEVIHDPSVNPKAKKRIDRTVINEKAFNEDEKKKEDLDNLNSETMSQQAFMKSVEEDAKKRSEDRRRRKIESDAIKEEAKKAFLSNDFEKALDLYNKAIDVRNDSCLLYTNRALTLLTLGLNTRALNDCEMALKLDENSFKGAVYKGKAYFQMGEEEKAEEWMKEVKEKFPDRTDDIEEYQKSWKEDSATDSE